ncbi:MAG: polysaccharide pyruvyl transferase family protein [Campylobacterota bacterium]|nr:polysaccharide pyruvyl transferase family protein [Campylobacterota bacterium]
MMIEIRKANFVNKGAELMLFAILEKLKEHYPDAKFCMPADFSMTPYQKRAKLGLYQKAELFKFGIQWGSLFGFLPQRIRKMYGLVLEKEVDIVINAAGFAYSDQWGYYKTYRLNRLIKRWKQNNSKVILLPQAFGPFKSKKMRNAIKEIIDKADLTYAREEISYDYLKEIVGDKDNVKLSPDFTNLVTGIVPENFDRENNKFCIVPNYRMIDKTSKEESDAYLPFMIKCAKYLKEKGQKPFILVHEGENDLILAQNMSDAIGGIPIVKETNALNIKGILGVAEGTIGSRFHGLVSALSQGVPSLATGWSHKYQMLFKEYGFSDGIMNVLMNDEDLYKKIDLILEVNSKRKIYDTLQKNSKILKTSSEQMWEEVFKLIDSK